jgi:methylenetetrahydrofolate reductase (NADPH)
VSRLEQKIRAGELVLTAELLSVDTGGLDAVHERFAPYEDYVDAVNATDNTAAHPHASGLAVAIALRQLGMEPILQVACRDRNRIALQADIVGAALHGIENLCCMTGDDVTAGDEPEAKRVFDVDSPQLIATAATLASGRYLSGRPLDPPPHLFIGCVENPGAPPYEERVERALTKVNAGARFIQLQVGFEPERLEGFMAQAHRLGLVSQAAIIPSILLVRGPSALRFIDEKVPGITVPPALIERAESAPDPEEACFQIGLELARHALSQPGIAGLHLISFRREAGIARLCRELGIPTRAEREASGYRPAVPV